VTPALLGLVMLSACATPNLRPSTLATPPPVQELWQQRDQSSLDLFHGVGGEELAPKTNVRFKFLEEDRTGASPGYTVQDETGREWDVKLGKEVQPEIVVSRFLWALGYHQPPTYYVASGWELSDAPENLKSAHGPQPEARFRPDLPGQKVTGDWKWYENPFVGTREFKGLVLANFLLSQMDLKTSNNKIYEVDPPVGGASKLYVVRDLGYALGREAPKLGWFRWRWMRGSKNDIEDFERTGFIRQVENRLEFDYQGLDPGLFEGISTSDIRWFCEQFARLSDRQMDDAFRAANYPQDIRDRYVRKIKEKIDQGSALAN
jgi:hypothetical protein